MKVPLLDLRAQYATIREEVERTVLEVLESQWFILGPKVQECEKQIAEYCGCSHAVGVTSGTDALLISLMAEGIGPGDEVITTPYTFFATAGSISRVGARPVFVDICPKTFNVDASQMEARVTEKTKAIIPVHLYGQCAAMDPIMEIAHRHGLAVIEDAAQAIGAKYKGRRAGSIGHYGCFSFFPSKNLGCAGDGGIVTTQDPDRAERLCTLRSHGSNPKYYHKLIGGNFRLDAIQAAIIGIKLKYLDAWTEARQANAARYRELFAKHGLIENGQIALPYDYSLPSSPSSPTSDASRHIYNQFVIRVPNRDPLRDHLTERGIGTEIYYPVPMHLQECFASLGYQEGDLPESELAARQTLALPIYPELSLDQSEYVVQEIAAFLNRESR